MRWLDGVNEASRLLTVVGLGEVPVEEGVLHVQLMDGLGLPGDDAQDSPDGGWLDDGTESLAVVDAGLLSETAKYPPSFVASERAVGVELMPKDPLPCNHISTYRTRHQTPRIIPH